MDTTATPLRSVDWVATRLGLRRYTIYDMARDGRLPAVRLGRTLRFDEVAIERWIAAGGTAGEAA